MKRYLWLSVLTVLLGMAAICQAERDVYNFNLDWKFLKDDPANGAQVQLNDSRWDAVSLPHTFNDGDTFDDFCEGHHTGEEKQWRGTVWYRKHFRIPAKDEGKRVYIEFEGVRQVAEVYLNGEKLGENWTGFIPFGYDLTEYIRFGEDNVLALRVNNDRQRPFLEENRMISNPGNPTPWNHENWHPCFGGIYRNVSLTIVDPVHVTMPLYSGTGGVGAYVYSITNSADRVQAGVEVEVANAGEKAVEAEVRVVAKDETGKPVAKATLPEQQLAAGDKAILKGRIGWDNPIRWEPSCPHVYQMEISVVADGKVTDVSTVPFGVRTFNFYADKGFYINGRHNKLHGWGQKPTQGWPGLGGAIQNWQRDLTLQMMQEAGGNLLRWGHSAASPSELEASDKYGIIVQMPGVDGERDCAGRAWEIRSSAFRDLIVRYRNYPSILMWEGGNYYVSKEHGRELRNHIDTFDPHGKRYFGFRMSNYKVKDVISVDFTTQGRIPFFSNLGCVEAEYLRDESPRRVWDNQSAPHFDYVGGDTPGNKFDLTQEDYINRSIKSWWSSFGSKAWHGGANNWVFSDGTHGGRQVVEVVRCSGEVDAVRLPKESYWAHQAMWRGDPLVQIVGHWNYPEGTKKSIMVVANTEEVELFVNGKSLGKGSRSYNHRFEWKSVKFRAGEIKAVGYIDGKAVAEQSEKTVGEPVALKLTPITAPGGWRADGTDVALVDVEVVDKEGHRYPVDEAPVEFKLEGAAEWRGGYNSGKENTTLATTLDTECGINRVSLRSTRTPGKVTLTVTRPGLKSATLTLNTLAVPTKDGLSPLLPARLPFSSKDAYAYAPYRTYDAVQHERPGFGKNSLFRNVTYTGSSDMILAPSAQQWMHAYTDAPTLYISKLPKVLKGAEMIRMPSIDGTLWANDLLEITPKEDIEFFVAHYHKLPRPAWLGRLTDTGETLSLGKDKFSIFRGELRKEETYTFSGNVDQGEHPNKAPMFMVFAKPLNTNNAVRE